MCDFFYLFYFYLEFIFRFMFHLSMQLQTITIIICLSCSFLSYILVSLLVKFCLQHILMIKIKSSTKCKMSFFSSLATFLYFIINLYKNQGIVNITRYKAELCYKRDTIFPCFLNMKRGELHSIYST